MTYPYSIKKTPKLLFLLIAAAILPATALTSYLYIGVWALPAALIIGIFFTFPAGKFASSAIQSNIKTHDDGITAKLSSGDTIRFTWKSITHTGLVTEKGRKKSVFIYDEHNDTYIQIPDEFENFENLIEELKGKTELKEYDLAEGVSVKELISEILEQE